MTARAFENTCAVVFVNAGGVEKPGRQNAYAGLSRLCMPFVGATGKETMDSQIEGMSIVELDMQILEEAEKQYKVREDMSGEEWHYVYRHDSFGKEKGKL
jgi:predicted amidohydrolase